MGIIDFFLKRKVFAWVINISIIILGIVGVNQLSTRLYPQIKQHSITIEGKMSDASPKQLESQVTIRLEKVLGGIYGLKEMYSSIRTGTSTTTLKFDDSVTLDEAFSNVQAALARVRSELPKEEKLKIEIRKSDNDASPLLYLLFTTQNKNYDIDKLYDFISRNFENTVKSQPGVASVDTWGGSKYEAKIILDSNKMKSLNVQMNDIYEAIKVQNIKSDVGKLVSQDMYITVMFDNSIKSEEDIENLFIKTRNESEDINIRIKDIGKVLFVPAKQETISKLNGQRVVVMSVMPQSNSSPVDISNNIKSKIEKWPELLPVGTKIEIMFNSSSYIESSIYQVYKAIFEAVILVLIIIFLFLGSYKASIIPLIAIPISLIGTFFVLLLFNCSINILTMLGLVLAVGLVVDDAIVVLENIYRYIERGSTPAQAASKGGKEIQFSIIAMTLTLAIVYAPIALIGGTVGSLFKEFAIALSSSVILSGIVALTISPIMCASILNKSEHNSKIYLFVNDITDKILRIYKKLLQYSLKHKIYTIMIAFILMLTAIIMYRHTKFEQFPREDARRIDSTLQVSPGYDISYILRQTDALYSQIEKSFPEVKYTMVDAKVGRTRIHHELYDNTKLSSFDIADKMQKTFDRYLVGIKDINVSSSNISSATSSSPLDEVKIQVFAKSDKDIKDIEEQVYKLTDYIQSNFKDLYINIYYSREPKSIQKVLTINNDLAAKYNIQIASLIENLSMYFQENISTTNMHKDNQIYSIRLVTDNRSQSHLDMLSVRGMKHGEQIHIPLKSLVKITEQETESSIEHMDGRKCMTFIVKLANNINPIDAYYKIAPKLKQELHGDYALSPLGLVKEVLDEQQNILYIFILAILFIYLVMSAQFDSFLDPIVVIFSIPMALFGAIFTIFISALFKGPLTINVYTQVGFLTLIGLITKHGILLVDFANTNFREGQDNYDESMIKSCILRFRPVVMTTLAIVIGSIPLVISSSTGYESRQQIGYCIIGGMLFGTIFTLFVIPSVYSLINDIKLFIQKRS